MTIEFNCPMCRKNLKASVENAGKSARCKHCGEGFTIPLFIPDESPPKPTSRKSSASTWEKLKRVPGLIRDNEHFHKFWELARGPILLLLGILYLGVVVEHYTNERRHGESDFDSEVTAVMTHLIVGSIAVWILLPKRIPKRRRAIATTALIGLGIYLLASTGSYTVEKHFEDYFFYESRHRSSDQPFYHSYTFKDTHDTLEGPLADTGSRHGKWTHWTINFGKLTVWYWHGEEVVEAEFFRLEAGR